MRKTCMLPTAFYTRPTLEVAHDLLGKYLVRRINGKTTAYKIVEVEAYDGPLDRACHAAKGKTPRTKVMFGQGGAFYVYFVYGMWEMLNIVTGPKEYPAAVLIRGVESAIGPGRLTKTLGITRALNGKRVAKTSGLWIEDRGEKVSEDDIKTTARIGVSYAGPIWSQKEYRFILKNYFSNKKKRR